MFFKEHLIPGLDNIFDLATEIESYLADRGIDGNVCCEFDYNDPDNCYSVDLSVDWDEDDDRQSFVVRNAHRLTDETLFDLWVREREQLHSTYLANIA